MEKILIPDISFAYLSNIVNNCQTYTEIKREIRDLFLKGTIKEPMKIVWRFSVLDREIYIYNEYLAFHLKNIKGEFWEELIKKYDEGRMHFATYFDRKLEISDRIKNISYQFNNFWKFSISTYYSTIKEDNIKKVVYYSGILKEYIEYEKDNMFLFDKYIGSNKQEKVNTTQKIETTKPQPNEVESSNKINLTSCSVQVSMLRYKKMRKD